MSGPEAVLERCFVDTNVWLYAFIEGEDPQKTVCAKALLETSPAVVVSTQVINEVCVNLLKKTQFSEQQIQQLIEAFYAKYVVVEVSKAILLKASVLREHYALSFWDSTIVSSALSAEAAVLYSEDMQDGLVVENRMRILNPFKKPQPTDAPLRDSSA
jgi:predicted nucleic acid-binding protein